MKRIVLLLSILMLAGCDDVLHKKPRYSIAEWEEIETGKKKGHLYTETEYQLYKMTRAL
ncbi:MAG: hypothetical protein LE169_03450 [Endomicrobium sp.]|nr:hypothetical protein [Endomicrobium sp.]